MDTEAGTAPDLARQLGISLPRVHRLLDAEGVPPAEGSGHLREVPPDIGERLLRTEGSVPQRVAGLSRNDMLVLAAVSRAGLGLESRRAVGRVATVSPTTAGKSLGLLGKRGLIRRLRQRIVQGRPREVDVWMADVDGPAWSTEVEEAVSRVILPGSDRPGAEERSPHPRRVPSRFAHLFRDADLTSLDPDQDGDYIASRMLTADDPDAWAWAIRALPPVSLRRASELRGLTPRRRALIANLAWAAGA